MGHISDVSALGPHAKSMPSAQLLNLPYQPTSSSWASEPDCNLHLLCDAAVEVQTDEEQAAGLAGRRDTAPTVLFLFLHAAARGFDASGRLYVNIDAVNSSAAEFITALETALAKGGIHTRVANENDNNVIEALSEWLQPMKGDLTEVEVLLRYNASGQTYIIPAGARPPRANTVLPNTSRMNHFSTDMSHCAAVPQISRASCSSPPRSSSAPPTPFASAARAPAGCPLAIYDLVAQFVARCLARLDLSSLLLLPQRHRPHWPKTCTSSPRVCWKQRKPSPRRRSSPGGCPA